jgi:hypothetical protein
MPPGSGREPGGERENQRTVVLNTLVDAILKKQRVFCWHEAGLFAFCPHAMGHREDGYHVLALLIVGGPELARERHQSPRRWRWLSLNGFRSLHTTSGAWWSAPRDTRPDMPNLVIDLEAE